MTNKQYCQSCILLVPYIILKFSCVTTQAQELPPPGPLHLLANGRAERQHRTVVLLVETTVPVFSTASCKGSLIVLRSEIRLVLSRYTLRMHIKCDFPDFTQLATSFIHILATDSQSIVPAERQARSTLTYRSSTLSSASDRISVKRLKDYCKAWPCSKTTHACRYFGYFIQPLQPLCREAWNSIP